MTVPAIPAKDIADAVRKDEPGPDALLCTFIKATQTTQAAGVEFLGRFMARQQDRDIANSLQTRDAHDDAACEWGIPDHGASERLRAIVQPAFVANGDKDEMIPPSLSYLPAGLIQGATIKIYPDAAHGFLFQHHAEFAAEMTEFLNAPLDA